MEHLALDIGKNLLGHLTEKRLLGRLIGFQVEAREQRVVIEHFLKVRHQPALVHRITMEPAAEMIVHPSLSHLAQRMGSHLQILLVARRLVLPQEQSENHRVGKFGRAAETALGVINVLGETGGGIRQGLNPQWA